MLTIKENVTNELVINKSKFITKLFKIDNENTIDNIFVDVKKEYKDATHYCYAYILNGKEKASDDKEPNGTAGLPILNVLKQNNLNYVLCIVIRYFGGIKLGSGGLVRAYTKATTEAILKSSVVEVKKYQEVTITFNYSFLKSIDYLLKDSKIVNKAFDDFITYQVIVENEYFNKIKEQLNKNCLTLEIEKEITM